MTRFGYAIVTLVAGCLNGNPPGDGPPRPVLKPTIVVEPHESHLVITASVPDAPADLRGFVTFRGTTSELTRSSQISAQFITDVDTMMPVIKDERVEVSFEVGVFVGTASVLMPAEYELGAITGAWSQPPIAVTWSPIGAEPLGIELTTSALVHHYCTGTAQAGAWPKPVPDTGMVAIDTRLIALDGFGFPCRGILHLVRSRDGTIDTGFSGGKITARHAHFIASN